MQIAPQLALKSSDHPSARSGPAQIAPELAATCANRLSTCSEPAQIAFQLALVHLEGRFAQVFTPLLHKNRPFDRV